MVKSKSRIYRNDWDIILNNQQDHEITYIRIPKYTYKKGYNIGENTILIRKDKPIYLDILLAKDTLIDSKSKLDFQKFVVKKIQY